MQVIGENKVNQKIEDVHKSLTMTQRKFVFVRSDVILTV